MEDLARRQAVVGRCPKCSELPSWFNDVPLKAFCWGPEDNPHPGVAKLVSGPAQPYGIVSRKTRWAKVKEKVNG